VLAEGTGGRPDYHRFNVDFSLKGPLFAKKTGKSRNNCIVRGGGVGAEGAVMN